MGELAAESNVCVGCHDCSDDDNESDCDPRADGDGVLVVMGATMALVMVMVAAMVFTMVMLTVVVMMPLKARWKL